MSNKKDQKQKQDKEALPEKENDAQDAAPEADEPEAVPDSQAPDSQAPDAAVDMVAETASEMDAEAPPKDLPPTYEELEEERTKLKDQLLRVLAEAENTRRRSDREKSDLGKYAIANFAREILSVADNLHRALGSVEKSQRKDNDSLDNFCVGIEMTEKELSNILSQSGVRPIEAKGQQFDHNLHQAMLEIEDDSKPAGTVVQEVQVGYMIHDRLLRPSMVGISKGGPKGEPAAKAKEQKQVPDAAVAESSQAYEKLAGAADPEEEKSGSKVDKKL